MDSSTAWFDEFREWAEALAGALAAVVFVAVGVVLPQVLDEVCAAGLFVGGPAWLLTRR